MRKILIVASGAVLLILLPQIAALTGGEYYISFFSRVLIYAIAAVSLDLLLGFSGMVSLGHAAFVGVGAYVVGIFFYHSSEMEPLFTWPFLFQGSENGLVVLPLAVIISALFALVIGALSLRTKGMHFIMITLAFAQMIYYFFVSLEKYGGDDGLSLYSRSALPGLDLGDDVQFYYLCLGLLALFLFLCVRIVGSRFGLVLRGGCDNERRLKALGVNSYMYKLACFVIAGAGAGLAGGLLANQTEYVSPGLMHWTLSGELMVMVLIGGMGTLFGPVLGAAVFLFMEESLAMVTEHWMIYMGPFLLLVVVFAKKGLFGLIAGEEKKHG
ncbi:branched-chain amino acid ABC transporter permease [Desulfospira joergensenii]|uniref:branched-chain amino acid ABC transporter permease n=1 Tax=Desulfospira joergensenii TaxID=53329 RepID=UPI0003FA2695|nr:branched-chain amino acid ABC transporter permease [Desulfospira joergensenii]